MMDCGTVNGSHGCRGEVRLLVRRWKNLTLWIDSLSIISVRILSTSPIGTDMNPKFVLVVYA